MVVVVGGFSFCVVLCLLLLVVSLIVGKFSFCDREKGSSYECGFEPMGPTRVPFSLRFFLVAVIFLVFDLEVVLLFSYVLSAGSGWLLMVLVWVFLLILGVGLGYEWGEGALEWTE